MAKDKVLIAYKGFDKDLKCRGFRFAIGESYEHKGDVKRCAEGFHSCEYPLNVFDYYSPDSSRYAVVEASGEIDRETDGDTKIASARIHIKAELNIPQIIAASIAWITTRCDPTKAAHVKGNRKASSATGDRSASSATGYSSASSATGDRSASSATGYRSASSAAGDRSASSATGYSSASSATGYRSASSATGDRSASSATGYRSASSATGYSSASSATGYSSASITTGPYSTSEVLKDDSHSVAVGAGYQNKVRGKNSCALFCVERGDEGQILSVACGIVGKDGIKADEWYSCKDGKLVAA